VRESCFHSESLAQIFKEELRLKLVELGISLLDEMRPYLCEIDVVVKMAEDRSKVLTERLH